MSERGPRLASIDLVRGFVMVLMALDHARDYFHDITRNPVDLETTTTALYLTRWVTHFCAPVFVLLAETSAFLYGRHRTRGELSWFLASRGAFLVVLEFTVVTFGWTLDPTLTFLIDQVIAAIGVSMLVLAALVWLPKRAVLAYGLVVVVGHNLLDPIVAADLGGGAWVWQLLHEPFSVISLSASQHVFVVYAWLPWSGVLACGYGLGTVFTWERARRRRYLAALGGAALAGFVLLRFANGYGNDAPWELQAAGSWAALLSFLNTQKYPPSLVFLLMTLGPALLALAALDREPGALGRRFVTLGRVPLFYYVAHIFALALASMLGYALTHGEPLRVVQAAFTGALPADFARPLWSAYVAWVVTVVALYPLCAWYAGLKRRSSSPLLRYL